MKIHNKLKTNTGKGAIYLLLIVWTLIVIFPIYWMVVTSVKTQADISSGATFIPFVDFKPSMVVWKKLYFGGTDEINVLRPFMNSTLIGIGSSIVAVFLGSFAGYGLSHFKYRFLNFKNRGGHSIASF